MIMIQFSRPTKIVWLDIIQSNSIRLQIIFDMFFEEKKEEILKLAEKETPLFIYDLQSIEKQASKLLTASKNVIHKIFYAMKANSNLQILQTLYKLGYGFECVSIDNKKFQKFLKKKFFYSQRKLNFY